MGAWDPTSSTLSANHAGTAKKSSEICHQKYRAEGVSAAEATMHTQRRLRPIVMTATAAVCGMLPLAFALGAACRSCSL
jgi:hypothetical protein